MQIEEIRVESEYITKFKEVVKVIKIGILSYPECSSESGYRNVVVGTYIRRRGNIPLIMWLEDFKEYIIGYVRDGEKVYMGDGESGEVS